MRHLIITFIALELTFGMLAFASKSAFASERADALREALQEADRLVVDDVDRADEANPTPPFEFKDAKKIAELVAQLDFNDAKSGFVCACGGEFAVQFYKGEKWLGTVGYHHGRSLRWGSKKWDGDALFTPAAAKAWREWFSAQGEPRFENLHQEFVKEMNRRRVIHEAFMAPFPKEAAAIFAEANTGVVTASPEREGSERAEELSPAAKKLLAVFPDKAAFGIAAAKALGSLCLIDSGEGSWSMSTSREQLVLECARTLKDEDFLAVLKSHDDTVLLGAARLFFFERLSELLPQAKRGPCAARLCEVVLRCDHSDNADSALRMLTDYDCDEATAVLERLAAGDIAVKHQASYKSEPAPQAAACLLLARKGSKNIGEIIQKVEATSKLDDMDKAALRVARSFNGERGVLDRSVFAIRSYTVGLGALAALEKEGGKAAIEAIVEGGTRHDWAAVREEAVLAVQRMTGQKWHQGEKHERADWYCGPVREWWKKNHESFRADRPAR